MHLSTTMCTGTIIKRTRLFSGRAHDLGLLETKNGHSDTFTAPGDWSKDLVSLYPWEAIARRRFPGNSVHWKPENISTSCSTPHPRPLTLLFHAFSSISKSHTGVHK